MARRQVSIFINGKEVEGTINNINRRMRELRRATRNNVEGSEEYNRAVREINRLNPILTRHRNNIRGVQSGWSKVSSVLGKAGAVAGISIAADALVDLGKQVFNNEIKMEALQKRAQTVFGEVLPEVQRNSRRFAQDLGLTTAEYINQAAAIGDLLIPMGFQRQEAANISTELLNVAGALSEFTGGQKTSKEVAESLNKALLGEREELKSLGISITEAEVSAKLAEKGLKGLTGATLQQAKAAATLELINEKSVDAQTAYAENTDTLIRRQARLQSQIGEVAAKLTSALLPVFERLVDIAEDVAGGIEMVGNVIDSVIDPAGAAADAFRDQQTAAEDLERDLNPLLSRYNELKEKTKLSRQEQQELKTIIEKIGGIVPTAVTQFNKYGEAIEISTEKVDRFVAAQQRLTADKNRDAIEEYGDLLENAERNLQDVSAALQNRDAEGDLFKFVITNARNNTGEFVKRTNEEVAELVRLREKYAKEVKETADVIKTLRGIDIRTEGEGNTDTAPPLSPTPDELAAQQKAAEKLAEQRKKQREKEAEDRRKAAEKLAADIAKEEARLAEVIAEFAEARRIAALSEEDQKIAELEAKYNEQIEKAKENQARGSMEATEQILELERQREEAVQSLRADFAAQEAERKAEAKQLLAEEVLTERELEVMQLEEHFMKLLELADQYGLDATDIRRKWNEEEKLLAEKYDNEEQKRLDAAAKNEIAQARAVAAAEMEIKQQRIGLLQDLGAAVTQILGENSKAAKAAFLFSKALSIAEVIVNLQRELAGIAAANAPLGPAGIPLTATQSIIAKVRAGVRIGTIGATAIQGVAQKKKGGWLDARGADDGQLYRTMYVGEQPTGLLDYSHPVLMHSAGQPVIANEAGREFFVNHKSMQNPAILNHVQAIDNIQRFQQFNQGGFNNPVTDTTAEPTTATAPPIDDRMTRALEQNNALLQMLLTRGVQARLADKTLVDANQRLSEISAASGGVLN